MSKRIYTLLLLVMLLTAMGAQVAMGQSGTVPTGSTIPGSTIPGSTIPPTIWELDDTLPVDPAVRTGTLENGLTYYVRANGVPAGRAELRLAINAGSILEDEDQLGLAHLLEHMLFNGTRNFPEQELIQFLQSIGMDFGPDLNAYTSFDETVYQLRLPTDDAETLARGVEVLVEWAAYATLDPDAIDQERDVVIEEWRARDQNANGRIQNQLIRGIFGNSRYADRRPIGDVEVIRNAPAEAVERFYETWYRPDLMAVVAVGDFDPDAMETLIRESFAPLENPASEAERTVYEVPMESAQEYLIITDPEIPTTQLQLYYKTPPRRGNTAGDYRQIVVTSLFNNLLNFRMDEISRQADAPWLAAGGGRSSFVRPADVYYASAQVADGGVSTGLDALATEMERIQRYGFTNAELARAKTELLRFYESAYNERNTTESNSYVREYVGNFLEEETIPGIAVEYELVQQFLPDITVEDVNAEGDGFAEVDNRTVVVIAPDTESAAVPDEDELADVLAAIPDKEIEPPAEATVDIELIPEVPAPAEILSESTDADLGTTTIELENGVRVIMKPTDFRSDEVLFSATSPGGTSLVSDENYPEADTIDDIVASSGLAGLNETELLQLLAGQNVSVAPFIDELNEGLSGSASPQDLETLFQLIHLYITEPQVDPDAFQAYRNQLRSSLVNRDLTPTAALQDTLFETLYGDTIRRGPLPLEEVDELDAALGLEIYEERFADAGDFTFIFVGSFDVDDLTELAQIYLGTLPATDREETWDNVRNPFPDGVIEEAVFAGQDEQSIAYLVYAGAADPTPENRLILLLLESVLDERVRETLREELGGVYSAGVYASATKIPEPIYLLNVAFGTDPERVEELLDAVFAIIDEVQTDGITESELANAKEQERRAREEQLTDNSFWVGALEYYVENPDEDPANILNLDERLAVPTEADLQQAAQEYLPDDRYIEVVLYPEGFTLD